MGSHLTKAYITVDTGEGVLTVFYSAGLKQRAHLTSDKFDLLIGKDDGPVRLGDTTVNVQDAAPIKVVVTSSEWQLIISPGAYTVPALRRYLLFYLRRTREVQVPPYLFRKASTAYCSNKYGILARN